MVKFSVGHPVYKIYIDSKQYFSIKTVYVLKFTLEYILPILVEKKKT